MNGKTARLVIGVAVLPLVPLLIGVLLITSGGSANDADHGIGSVKIIPLASTSLNGLTRQPSFASNKNGLPPGRGALIARITSQTAIRSSPGGARIGSLGLKTTLRSPR